MQLIKRVFLFICFFSGGLVCRSVAEPHTMGKNLTGTWQYVDFEASMFLPKFAGAIRSTKRYTGIEGETLLSFFKDLYEQNNLTRVVPQEEPRIPKIIHVIWLGSPLPDVLREYVDTWIAFHPDWEVYLWNDETVKKIKLHNQDLYDKSRNAGMKSDILRYELIYQFGGLYVDTDFECLQPFDIFHHCYDFYAGLLHLDTYHIQVGCGLFGARPGHPILKHCIEHLRESYYSSNDITQQTGPIHFTKSVYAVAGSGDDIDCIFPATYFFPFGCQEKEARRDMWDAWGSFGVHWWSKTWAGPSYRPKKFRGIKNMRALL